MTFFRVLQLRILCDYSATGRKLLAYADGHDQPDGTPVHRLTAYVGPSGFQYATDASDSLRLLHVPTPEGRLVFLPDRADKNAGFGWQYEYHLKDQVGNLRLAFRTRGRTARDIEDSFEPDQGRSASASATPQVEHENETRYRAPLLARTGEHVALVNARDAQHRVGPSLTVPVSAGDSVYASVYARVEPPLPRPWWKMALPSPEIAELDGAKNSRRVRFWPRLGVSLSPWLLQQHRITTGQVYMRVQTLNEQQQVLGEERFYVDPTVSPTQWQYLLAKLAAAQSGYVRVELVNESGDNAYFDDLQVRLVNELIQENHYDPFGLNLAELEVKGDPDCKYQFNGKEKQEDFGLGWNDHGWRNYAPDGSRWFSIDPLAAEFPDESPYVFGHNNPIIFNDLDGRAPNNNTSDDPPSKTKKQESTTWSGLHMLAYFIDGIGKIGETQNIISHGGTSDDYTRHENFISGLNIFTDAIISAQLSTEPTSQNSKTNTLVNETEYTVKQITSKASKVIAPAKRVSGLTVLGHYPEYTNVAHATGARYFYIPTKIWNAMPPEEAWAANARFLDRTIMRIQQGERVILTPFRNSNSSYAKELKYLYDKGFEPDATHTQLVPRLLK